MTTKWYYLQNQERKGPTSQEQIEQLFNQKNLGEESYVWRKGMKNWAKLKSIDELSYLLQDSMPAAPPNTDAIPRLGAPPDWEAMGLGDQTITIKIGFDRGGQETEYGPFSIAQLKKAYQENRINDKTYVFVPGMDNWSLIGDLPLFKRISGSTPVISDTDRRKHVRKPVVARIIFHDNTEVYEGLCRDISVGGMQVLVSNFPGTVGESVTLNVHPHNSEHCFTAEGSIVRILDGNQGFSLRFSNLGNEAQRALSSYINS